MSEVKIEHFENDIQCCTFIFTSSDGDQQIAWEGEADYLAIKQLQATIAEQGAEIARLKAVLEGIVYDYDVCQNVPAARRDRVYYEAAKEALAINPIGDTK